MLKNISNGNMKYKDENWEFMVKGHLPTLQPALTTFDPRILVEVCGYGYV
jgi:hypothetical protein